VNNYLASIAARTLNTASPVRPRLPGRFDPTPANSEGPINKPHNDRFTRELRRVEPEIDTTNLQARHHDSSDDINNAPYTVSRQEPVSPQPREAPQATLRPVDVNATPPQPLSAIRAHVEAPSIRQHPDESGPLKARDSSARETPETIKTESRKEIPEPIKTESRKVESAPIAAQPPPTSTLPHNATPVIQPLPDRRAGESTLTQPLSVPAKSSVERELQTVIIREKTLPEDSTLRPDPGLKPLAVSDNTPPSNEIQNHKPPADPVTVHFPIVPLVEYGPERMPLIQTRPQPSPTIQVTIGRIEIRAVQQSQPPAKPRASQPVMNLDDYLRRRTQGSA
jgi:hypothetical protein